MRALCGLSLVVLACGEGSAPAPAPRVLAVDLLDAQRLSMGQPTRHRLWDARSVMEAPASGPDLYIEVHLSAVLSRRAAEDAPRAALLVRSEEGGQVGVRGFESAAAAPGAPEGTRQTLSLAPDVRSDRGYSLFIDTGPLESEEGRRFELFSERLRFVTARRFIVLRSDPADGEMRRVVTQIRLVLSSRALERPSMDYGVSLSQGRVELRKRTLLIGSGRVLAIEPDCPLPRGETLLVLGEDGIEEDDTRLPLAERFEGRFVVAEDPGPCT